MRLSGSYNISYGKYYSLALHSAVIALLICKLPLLPHKEITPEMEAVMVEFMVLHPALPSAESSPQNAGFIYSSPTPQPLLSASSQAGAASEQQAHNRSINSLIYNREPQPQAETAFKEKAIEVASIRGEGISTTHGNTITGTSTGSDDLQSSSNCDGNIINLHAINNNPCAGPNRGWGYAYPVHMQRSIQSTLQENKTAANGYVSAVFRNGIWVPKSPHR
jgi:hypothetical protein